MGFTEVAGYYTQLQKEFIQLGIQSIFIDLTGYKYQKTNVANNTVFFKLLDMTIKGRSLSKSGKSRIFWFSLQQILLIPLFFWSILKFDTFIFGFRTSFLWGGYDLAVLRLLKKKVIWVFHGSDSRPTYMDGAVLLRIPKPSITECMGRTKAQKKLLEQVEKYADVIISHPASSQLHTRKFIPWLQIGVPTQIPKHKSDLSVDLLYSQQNSKVRLLHSPSHPESKGTDQFRLVVQKLKAKGLNFDWIEILNRPNVEVLAEIARADIIIDQLYSDTPMATFATEAAYQGKPALVGSYSRDEDWGVDPSNIPPTALCHPDDLEKTLEHLILDREAREKLGKQAQQFVLERWQAHQVAARILQVIQDIIPNDWWYDPNQIDYIQGYGLSLLEYKKILKDMIAQKGVSALQLSDKPQLEQKILDLIRS